MVLARARSLAETWLLARAAADWAGVTRVADIGGLAGLGLPVFQAIRPFARSLTVAQGKGGSALAAKVSAVLEATELACAEALPHPGRETPLVHQSASVRRFWSGSRAPLTLDLDPDLPRAWVDGRLLDDGEVMAMPWDLLSLDFTRGSLEFPASSAGLATGNTRDEALFAALCELVEHDLIVRFDELEPFERLQRQIDTDSITDPALRRELGRVTAAGFTPRLWSMGQDCRVPVIACVLFTPEPMLDDIVPAGGSACHVDAAVAALGALREAVQGRAALVAGARDDIAPTHYTEGRRRAEALAMKTLALGEGQLAWREVPTHDCASFGSGVALLAKTIARLTTLPVAVFDHLPPVPGLHIVHALAPGLRHLSRRPRAGRKTPRRPVRSAILRPPDRGRAVLFAGPSIAGLDVPRGVEIRPPAVCGDLAGLAIEPPSAVGLVDGHFGIAPSVWHKEILHLLARGVRVMGAASIGALRAAELAEAGMEGVGAIYAAYRSGAIERDDAVMVLQAPPAYGFAPLSLALVDAEFVLQGAACGYRERRMMQRIVRTMPYQIRNWQRCLDSYRRRVGSKFPLGLEELSNAPSLKQQDAAALLERLVSAARSGPTNSAHTPPPMTSHFLKLLARSSQDPAGAHHG
jgi:YcaO-like protein with predicted kinase domain